MVIFHCHASFPGSNSCLSVWSTFIKSPTVTKCSNLQYHSPPWKFRNLQIGHSAPNPRKFTPIPKKYVLKKVASCESVFFGYVPPNQEIRWNPKNWCVWSMFRFSSCDTVGGSEIWLTTWGKGSLSHYLQKFLTSQIPGGFLAGFLNHQQP